MRGAGENGTPYIRYEYNIDGQRTKKILQYPDMDTPTVTEYFYNGDILAGQKTGNKVMLFLYDETGNYFGFTYEGHEYYYVKNAQNDVIGIATNGGWVVAHYFYDAWGNVTIKSDTGYTIYDIPGHPAADNPIRYRSYYYDAETQWYFLSSRYYSPAMQRFLNADSAIAGTGESVHGYNLFAYCFNNSVNYSDENGNWPQWLKNAANTVIKSVESVVNSIANGIKSIASSIPNTLNSSHDANRRPNTGKPGSTYRAPNGDTRTYGPDGNPLHDYDHDDHGHPANHPHDENGGHNHDWDNGVRGPAYSINWEAVAGVALVTICIVGIAVIAADDATGIGVADDVLFVPLGTGVSEGLILIFS